MSGYVTKIRTTSGDLEIDYNALANKPEIPDTLQDFGITATSKELNYVKGTKSSIQNQIDDVQEQINHTNETIENLEFTTSLEDLNISASAEEINNTKGTTAPIQTQIDLINQLFTNTGVQIETDLLKKLDKSGGAMTGALTTNGVVLTEGADYGVEYPANATKGQVFFVPDTPPVDYIVDQDTADGWTWRKWNSGIAECWKVANYDNHSSYGNSNNYYNHYDTITFPFSFVDAPCVTFTACAGSGYAYPGRVESTNTTCKWYISVNMDKAVNINIHMQVVGRWK